MSLMDAVKSGCDPAAHAHCNGALSFIPSSTSAATSRLGGLCEDGRCSSMVERGSVEMQRWRRSCSDRKRKACRFFSRTSSILAVLELLQKGWRKENP